MKNTLKQFLSDKTNWVSIITFLFAIVGVFVSFFYDSFTNKVISIMLVMIALENFIAQITYLEQIRTKVQELRTESFHTPNHLNFFKRNSYSFNEKIEQAKKELFFSGTSLISLVNNFSYLAQIAEKGVKIRLLVNDVEDSSFKDAYLLLGGTKLSVWSLQHLSLFANYDKIEVRKTKKIMPLVFAAYDMETEHGYIQATEHWGGVPSIQHPVYEITHSNGEWYDIHREYIEKLWESGEPLFM
jgi:hypothetical protein